MAIRRGIKSVLIWLENEKAMHIHAHRKFELIYNANYKQARLYLDECSLNERSLWQAEMLFL